MNQPAGKTDHIMVYQIHAGQPTNDNVQQWMQSLMQEYTAVVQDRGGQLISTSSPVLTPIGSVEDRPMWYTSVSGLVWISHQESQQLVQRLTKGDSHGEHPSESADGAAAADSSVPYAGSKWRRVEPEEAQKIVEQVQRARRESGVEEVEQLTPFNSGVVRADDGGDDSGDAGEVPPNRPAAGRFPDLRDL